MKKRIISLWVACGIVVYFLMLPLVNVWADDNETDIDDSSYPEVEVYIKMINPGYTVDGKNNVGEVIEIGKRSSDEMVSLAGLTVGYTNLSGNYAVLAEFPENSYLVGESLLLRLASSPEHELAALNYTKTLALKAGPLVLMRDGRVVDSVCWNGREGCAKEFKSAQPTVLVRDAETMEYEHVAVDDYVVRFDKDDYLVKVESAEEGYGSEDSEIVSQCKGMMFSEVLSYYEESQREQFIELYNSTAEQVLLNGCSIRYKNKNYMLDGIAKAEEYVVRYLTDFSITKNPTNVGVLELIDITGETIDRLEYPNGQRKGTAWAFIGYDANGGEIWRTTYAPTPSSPNNYQEYRTCEAGKVINEVTGNCVKVVEVTEKTCAEGQYLNPLTGRCNKIEEVKSTVCREGYYLNEETGKCKKIVENKGADYGLVTETYEEKSSFVALYGVIGIITAGLVYVGWQFRHEIRRLFGRVFRRSH